MERDLGIDLRLFIRWLERKQRKGTARRPFSGQGVPRDEEMACLRREVEDLREAKEILKDDMFILAVQRWCYAEFDGTREPEAGSTRFVGHDPD